MHYVYAYIGSEIEASLTKVAYFQDMWRKIPGLEDFQAVMGRDQFKSIRSALLFYPGYDHDFSMKYPLRYSRLILQHLRRNCVAVAVTTGVPAFDENTIRCKGGTAARSYIKRKPVKFGVRFYANVEWK